MSDEQIEAALTLAKKANSRITELEQEVDQKQSEIDYLREEVAELQLALDETRDNTDWDNMDRDEKVRCLQETAYDWARNRGGMASLDYKEVRDGVFGGEPSDSYCYKLMRLAGEQQGFTFANTDGGQRLRVKTDAVKAGVFAGEKRRAEGAD